jgi:hypothetical protein
MKNDPDIIRWSTLKGFGKHFVFWFVFYGIAGWLIDINKNANNSLTTMMLWLVGLSLFMAYATSGDKG